MSNKAAFVVIIFPEIRLISEGYLLPLGKRESKVPRCSGSAGLPVGIQAVHNDLGHLSPI